MYQRILVPIDGSPTAHRGLEEAIRLAKLTHGRLRLIHVVDELSLVMATSAYAGYSAEWIADMQEAGKSVLAEAEAVVRSQGIEVDSMRYDNLNGAVPELIVAEADNWPADVIVIGTHGRRGIGRLMLGSSAENVLRFSRVPVLLIRAPEVAAALPVPAAESSSLHMPAGVLAME